MLKEEWVYVGKRIVGNAAILEFHKPMNGGTLVMAVTESKVDDTVSTSLVWAPSAPNTSPAI